MSEPPRLAAHERECGGLKSGPFLGFPLIYGLTGLSVLSVPGMPHPGLGLCLRLRGWEEEEGSPVNSSFLE